ncbi:hypothetical protein [Polyangium fumosum]|uniref:Uncharacterized protein n=1 Tax=Polyangium fumosum TaxID=889272 RepID=A0A4U1JDT8_9BACT|nr:hypothetical protein [Polyangium fumosum]TKD09145.1 hypothetical protein E8A74_12730 [Polyangium fumosum]
MADMIDHGRVDRLRDGQRIDREGPDAQLVEQPANDSLHRKAANDVNLESKKLGYAFGAGEPNTTQ